MYQYVVGGLGNQLFQFAMLHFIAQNTVQEKATIWIDKKPRDDRPFLLAEISSECRHIAKVEKPYSGPHGLVARAATKLGKFISFADIGIVKWPEQREYAFNAGEDYLNGKNKFWIGYFQNYRYVEEVWPTIKPEIFQHLNSIQIPDSLPTRYLVIHVRGGDFFKLSSTQGVLSANYYQEALLKFPGLSNLDVVIVTDDVDSVQRVSLEINPDFIIGPNDLNEWQTLKLMANAQGLIMANSTFSWWGGRMALEHGCKVFLPSPWVKTDQLSVGDAFQHPDFIPIKSYFEE